MSGDMAMQPQQDVKQVFAATNKIDQELLGYNQGFKYLSIISMISVTFLIIAMLFTYKVITIGSFILPGGVFVFPLTYFFADVVAEVYGYRHAKLLIWGNFACIFIFNITNHFLMKLPVPANATYYSAYQTVFSHNFSLILAFSLSFAVSDFINAYAISRWRILLEGKYFLLRIVASSIIGQIIFTIMVTIIVYSHTLAPEMVMRQFTTTLFTKIIIIFLLAYPAALTVALLRRFEN